MSWIASETSAEKPNVGFDGVAPIPRSPARMQTIVSRITTLLASAVGDEAASAMCRLGIVRKICGGNFYRVEANPLAVDAGRCRAGSRGDGTRKSIARQAAAGGGAPRAVSEPLLPARAC